MKNDTVLREGTWRLLNCTPDWDGNWSSNTFISFTLPYDDLAGKLYHLKDLMSSTVDERPGDSLVSGLYFDMPGWGYHMFGLQPFH